MDKRELIHLIIERTDMTITDTYKTVEALVDVVLTEVEKGETVRLAKLGSFTKVERKARNGFNPATGEKITIKAKTAVKFKAAKAFKETLNK